MKYYLAGPMSGIPDHNFPAFFAEEKRLRSMHQEVVNPARLHHPYDLPKWEDAMRIDIAELVKCDAIFFLPGWEKSAGAKLEYEIALALGMPMVGTFSGEIPCKSKYARVAQPLPESCSWANLPEKPKSPKVNSLSECQGSNSTGCFKKPGSFGALVSLPALYEFAHPGVTSVRSSPNAKLIPPPSTP